MHGTVSTSPHYIGSTNQVIDGVPLVRTEGTASQDNISQSVLLSLLLWKWCVWPLPIMATEGNCVLFGQK